MKVKICGITDVNTAVSCVNYGADAIGFVFAESKRKITPEDAREIVSQLPANIHKVGVFVNETKENIIQLAQFAGLTHIQLHGDETPDFCEALGLPVIKAISADAEEIGISDISKFPCEYFLVDGPKGEYRGGNGIAFDWQKVNSQAFKRKRLILAGGLDEGNVEEAISLVNPYMVDVSSGVETEGVKDLQKIKRFIKKAKGSQTGGIKDENIYTTQ